MKKKPKFNPREEQAKILKELGDRLAEIRRQQGRSIEEIANQTRIQGRLLKAIESGKMEILPEPIYIKGLIKQFADALGLEGTDFAQDFPTGYSPSNSKSFSWKLPGLQLRPIHLYFLYIAVILFAVRGISDQVQQANGDLGTLQANQTESWEKNHLASNITTSNTDEITISRNSQLASDKPVVVDIEVQDQCWLKVVVDGKTEFEGDLPKGTHKTWVANEKLTVRAGNAGGVLVAFNDQKAKQLGEPGKVQEVTYQANSRL